MRVGSGFDVHGFDASRPLIIGGVHIPDSPGLSGHSDADVLCHAISDAILGAARLGDLGALFPSDARWEDASSLTILAATVGAARDAGWTIGNIDSTVVAEAPRFGPYKAQMIANIAEAAEIDQGFVSVKATTTDGLGFTGRGEGIAAFATVLLDAVALQ